MKCPSCGVEVVDGSEFCTNCGCRLSQNTTPQQPNIQIPNPQDTNNNQQNVTPTIVSSQPVQPEPVIQTPTSTVQAPVNNQPSQVIVPQTQQNSKSNKSLLIIVFVIIGILIVGGGFLFVTKTILPSIIRSGSVTGGSTGSGSNNKDAFTVVDPLNHTITIVDDDIYGKTVELSYLFREADTMREKAKKITEEEIEKMNITESQKQALKRAASYLRSGEFSKNGLIGQLEYESISHADAVYAVENCKADWKEEALISAKTTLGAGGFSEKEVRSLLEYDQFTSEEVEYGMKNLNADYYEQAVYDACLFKYNSALSYDKATAKERLESNGYSSKEAAFAVKVVYEQLK